MGHQAPQGHHRYGYDTNLNTELIQSRHMQYKTDPGSDPTHYYVDGAGSDLFGKYKPTMDRSQMPGGNDGDIDLSNPHPDPDGRDAHAAGGIYVSDDDKYKKIMEGNTIEHVKARIDSQKQGQVLAIQHAWEKVKQSLETMAADIQRPTDALVAKQAWTGDAAEAFLQNGPGAALKSLDDWIDAAQYNIEGFQHIASVIPTKQQAISDLYEQYKAAVTAEAQRWLKANAPRSGGHHEIKTYTQLDDFLKHGQMEDKQRFMQSVKQAGAIYDLMAQDIEHSMAVEYQTAIGNLQSGRSTTFEGIRNSIIDAPGMPILDLPGRPPGSAPPTGPRATPNGPAPRTFRPASEPPPVADPPAVPDTPPVVETPPPVSADLPTAPPATPPAPEAPPAAPPAPGAPPPVPVAAPAPTGPPGLAGRPAPGSGPGAQRAFRPNVSRPQGLNRSGVLGDRTGNANRPSGPGRAPTGAGEHPNPGRGGSPSPGRGAPPSPAKPTRGRSPGSPGGEPQRGGQGRPPGGRNPASPGRPNRASEQRTPGFPGSTEESTAFTHSGPRSPSVLTGSHQPTADPASTDTPRLSGRPGSGPPNTTKPILNNRQPKKPGAEKRDPRTGHAPPASGWPGSELVGEPPATAPSVLENPTLRARPAVPTDGNEIPRGLRPSGAMRPETNLTSARPNTNSPAELAARKAAQREKERRRKVDAEYEQIRALLQAEEAWQVETPGGPVVSNQPRAEIAHPRPMLGS
ncbi:WXG100 family type VII secretion target [Actinocatenispora sera]|uniref:Uncharacterized protein n=1 Tax=Actinocatenispora sera TaxID=390989 RepID=A0A810LC13_9ACTN|nr:hypothetical protein [Actinocatenispora sera]BCJ32425.1 hypothetical protein Asera_65330 [Actinocatenispora sera]